MRSLWCAVAFLFALAVPVSAQTVTFRLAWNPVTFAGLTGYEYQVDSQPRTTVGTTIDPATGLVITPPITVQTLGPHSFAVRSMAGPDVFSSPALLTLQNIPSPNGMVMPPAAALVDDLGHAWEINGVDLVHNGSSSGGAGTVLGKDATGRIVTLGLDSQWWAFSESSGWSSVGTSVPPGIVVGAPPPPPPPPPPPLVTMTVEVVTASCKFTVTDTPPDTRTGWKVQFRRDGGTSVGSSDSTAPYTRTVTLAAGTYGFYAVWTKSGVPTVTRPVVSVSACLAGRVLN